MGYDFINKLIPYSLVKIRPIHVEFIAGYALYSYYPKTRLVRIYKFCLQFPAKMKSALKGLNH